MQGLFFIVYIVVGFAQLFAVMDGVKYATGIDGFFGFLIGISTTYIPFLGAGLGVYGAVNVWEWSLISSLLLFFWFIPVGLVLTLFKN